MLDLWYCDGFDEESQEPVGRALKLFDPKSVAEAETVALEFAPVMARQHGKGVIVALDGQGRRVGARFEVRELQAA